RPDRAGCGRVPERDRHVIASDLPITAGDLSRWSSQLEAGAAARAEVAVGLDLAELGAWTARRSLARAIGQPVGTEPFLWWSADAHKLEADPTGLAAMTSIEELAIATDPDRSFRSTPAPLRLAVGGPGLPNEII